MAGESHCLELTKDYHRAKLDESTFYIISLLLTTYVPWYLDPEVV